MRTDLRADAPHPLHDGAEVDRHSVGDLHAEPLCLPELRHDARGPDHRLRGDAADVEAVTAQEVSLDQRHAGAEPRRAGRRHEPGRPGADDHQVVPPRGLRVAPAGRVDVLEQRPIVGVVGEQGWRMPHVVAPPQELPAPAVHPKQWRRGPDSARVEPGGVEVAHVRAAIRGRLHRQLEHLVEVAVVERPVPGNRDRVAAHQASDRGRIEGAHEPLHVCLQIAALDEPVQETADRHVRQSEEAVERDAVLPGEPGLPVTLERRLRPWKEGSDRIAHEGQPALAGHPARTPRR